MATDQLNNLPWIELLERTDPKEAHCFASALGAETVKAQEKGDIAAMEAYRLLARLLWARLFDIPAIPKLRPKLTEDKALELPWALTKEEIDEIGAIKLLWPDPEFQAHLGDLLWILRKDYAAAKSAALAYLESADRLFDPVSWNTCEERYRRALELALAVDSKGETVGIVVARIEAVLERLCGADPRLLTLRLASMLHDRGVGNTRRLAELLEGRGERDGMDEEPHELNSMHFTAAARLYRHLGDDSATYRCQVSAAEEMARHASERFSKGPAGRLSAPHFMAIAVRMMREIAGKEARATELHVLMLEWQRAGMADMFSFGEPMALSESDMKILSEVVGSSFVESIGRLATMMSPTSVGLLRKFAEQEVQSPLFRIVPPAWLRADGKLDERLDGIPVQGPVPEQVLRKLMHHHARTAWQVSGLWVYGALDFVRRRYADEGMDLNWLVYNSDFVPEGRQQIFKRGLEAGLKLDFLEAMHFLVPQVENSLRNLLALSGGVSSRLEDDDTQDEHLLRYLLEHPQLTEKIGEDTMFDLAGLLNERPGANIRNELAHGMASENRLQQIDCLYLWWLVLRLCVQNFRITAGNQRSESEPSGG